MADTNTSNGANGKKPTVPYPPFKTFLATLDSFAQFMPNRIDPSVWTSYSGGMRSQLLSTYKFFGLIKDDGTPMPELKKLADEKDQRPVLLRDFLKHGYSDLMKLDLTRATPQSFDAEFRKYGLDGDTHRKAIAFFLQAAKFCQIHLSPLLTKRGSLTSTRRTRRTPASRSDDGVGTEVNRGFVVPQPIGAGPSRQFSLPNGTVITLGTSVDAFHMPVEDRKIVFALLEQLEGYGEPPQEEERAEESEHSPDEQQD